MSQNGSRYQLQKVVDKLKGYQYTVRFEKGNFHTGTCVLEDKKVIVVNKFHDNQAKIENLRTILSEIRNGRKSDLVKGYTNINRKEE